MSQSEHMSIDDYKVLIGKSANRGSRETRSKDKEKLGQWLLYSKLPWVKEYKFCPTRRFRADWALVDPKILVEYEGGIFHQGKSHSNGVDYTDDCEKYAIANIEGFIVVRCTAKMVGDGRAFELIERAIKSRQQ